tara:strand:+ start:42 stop:749 length:708 start_codon:yes stop_codon:yes gene_type:complete
MADRDRFGGSEREYPHPTVEEKSGLGSFFERFFGGRAEEALGSMDPNAGQTYYPPTNVNQVRTYVDTFPEAKQVAGPRQYGGQQPTPFKAARGPYDNLRGGLGLTRTIQDEMSQYGGSPTRRNWYDEIRSLYEPGGYYGPGSNYEEYGPLQFQQSLHQGLGDTIEDDSEMQYFPELEDYYASGEFNYPDPGMVYGTDDYMLPRTMIPGYELGQGLNMDPNLEPIQRLRSKLMGYE